MSHFSITVALSIALGLTGFILSRIYRRNDVADVMWGIGFPALAWAHHVTNSSELGVRTALPLLLVTLWGVRLSLHLGLRAHGQPEDSRYARMRENWGSREPLMALLGVFALQSALLAVISTPLISIVSEAPRALSGWDFLGLSLSLVGLLIETLADAELTRFKKSPSNRGKTLNTGLWAISRHPNYFGEILFWWGIFFFSVHSAQSTLGLISPLLLTWLLLRISGVPLVEAKNVEHRPDYRNYIHTVPAVFPFHRRDIYRWLVTLVTTLILDFLWLGVLMKDFYISQTQAVARISNGSFDTVIWAGIGVYAVIPMGVLLFCSRSKDSLGSILRGCLFGFILYGVYEFTNIALVREWPLEMGLVDLLWGPILCGSVSWVASKL